VIGLTRKVRIGHDSLVTTCYPSGGLMMVRQEPFMESAVATTALTKSFGRETALRDVSLYIAPGSVFALVGPNGAGKTTLLKILMNILAPTSGNATILGLPSTELRGRAFTNIGYVSENQEMPEWMTITRFLNFVRPIYPQWDRALEASLLQRFDLRRSEPLHTTVSGMLNVITYVRINSKTGLLHAHDRQNHRHRQLGRHHSA